MEKLKKGDIVIITGNLLGCTNRLYRLHENPSHIWVTLANMNGTSTGLQQYIKHLSKVNESMVNLFL